MTIEEKAKAYDEALEKARARYDKEPTDGYVGYANQILKELFPTLVESEDEKIRKILLKMAKVPRKEIYEHEGITKEQAIDYLEKQKKQKGLDVTDFCQPINPDIAKVLPDVINELTWGDDEKQKESPEEPKIAFGDWGDKEKQEAIFTCLKYMRFIKKITNQEYNDLTEWLGSNLVYNLLGNGWYLKQKEQDNEEDDFTIYHPLKNGEGKYECIPYSFYGSLTSFSNDKDLMDFLNESFYDKKECEEWCERENKPELPDCKHKIKKDSVFDYLCDNEKRKEQEPLSPEDKVKHPLYVEGFEAGKEVGRQCEEVFGKQKENSKLEDSWHKAKDSLPDNTREVICKDAIGNFFIGRYYKGSNSWEVSMYDDCDKSNEDNPPVVMWCDIPSEKQKELPLMNGDSDAYFDEWNLQQQNPTKRQCFEEGIKYAQRLQKEQKPILKFKVGDKIHLIDGTSPNYEDDCITIREVDTLNYIGEFKEGYVPIKEQDKWELEKEQKPSDLPAGFYFIDQDGNKYYSKEFRFNNGTFTTTMKIKEEQKSADDKAFEEWIDDWWKHNKANNPDSYDKGDEIQFDEKGFKNFCRGIRNMYAEQKPAEWSEEDNVSWDEAFACVTRAEKSAKNEEELQNAVTAEKWLKEIKFKYYVHPVKQEWSEEDEHRRTDATYFLESAKSHYADTSEIEKTIVWLKDLPLNLKKRNDDIAKLCSNEWSDEDEKSFNNVLSGLKYAYEDLVNHKSFDSTEDVKNAFDWLKSLRPPLKDREMKLKILKYLSTRCSSLEFEEVEDYLNNLHSSWKPSKAQMDALKEASASWMNKVMGNCKLLESLYNDLKKLM